MPGDRVGINRGRSHNLGTHHCHSGMGIPSLNVPAPSILGTHYVSGLGDILLQGWQYLAIGHVVAGHIGTFHGGLPILGLDTRDKFRGVGYHQILVFPRNLVYFPVCGVCLPA